LEIGSWKLEIRNWLIFWTRLNKVNNWCALETSCKLQAEIKSLALNSNFYFCLLLEEDDFVGDGDFEMKNI